jgi:hypothetical protein
LDSYEETGGSPVLNYKVRFDQGSLIGLFVDVFTLQATESPSYYIEGLSPGETYKITIVAENIHGWSTQSNVM